MVVVARAEIEEPVVFVGERVRCTLTLHNTDHVRSEEFAWGSAQLYCHCVYRQSKIRMLDGLLPRPAPTSADFAFSPSRSERGLCVFQSNPEILFCKLLLGPRQIQTYTFEVFVPQSSPPSFRGDNISYSYKLTVGLQRALAGSHAQLLKVGLRVLPVIDELDLMRAECGRESPQHALPRLDDDTRTPRHGSQDVELTRTLPDESIAMPNPFLSAAPSPDSASQRQRTIVALRALSAKHAPSTFAISSNGQTFVRALLWKTCYRLGEELHTWLDFSQAAWPCLQVVVALECVESIAEEFCVTGPTKCVNTIVKRFEACLHTSLLSITLPIPLASSSEFHTHHVDVSWRLAFEFVVHPGGPLDVSRAEAVVAETVVWNLPIRVLPANPATIPYRSGAKEQEV